MKRCFTLDVIREMQIKTTMRYRYIPITRAKIRNTMTTPNAGEDVEEKEPSFIADENEKWYSHFGRQCYSFLQTKHMLSI